MTRIVDFREAYWRLRTDFREAYRRLRTDFREAYRRLRTDFREAYRRLRTDFRFHIKALMSPSWGSGGIAVKLRNENLITVRFVLG